MHDISKAAIIPGCLFLSSVALTQWTADNSPFFRPSEADQTVLITAMSQRPDQTQQWDVLPLQAAPSQTTLQLPDTQPQTRQWPRLPTTAELQQLDSEELVTFMLNYRTQHQFDVDFMAQEYQLFQSLLDIEPFAAFDYMIAIGHDSSTEFFFNFLYSDFMVHDGRADEVIDYLNINGPELSLMNLVAFANMTDRLSSMVQQAVLDEYLAGNISYHRIIRAAQWDSRLTPLDRVTAFMNTNPVLTEDPYDLIKEVVELNKPSTFPHLLRYLTEHPDRYRLYQAIRQLEGISLSFEVDQMMADFDQMSFNNQVQSALIALDFGHYDALKFLLNVAKAPVVLDRPLNVEYSVLHRIKAPDYVDKSLQWAIEHFDLLTFNPYSGRFEY